MPFGTSTGHPFTEGGITAFAPRHSGVYGINNAKEWIYIGEANDIEARLLEHLRGASVQSTCILLRKPTIFVFESCDEITRMVREGALIRELDPYCNRA